MATSTLCDTAVMRTTTPEQRKRSAVTPQQRRQRAAADRALRAAVARYLHLEQEIKAAREDVYTKVWLADKSGMRKVDIVDRTVGLGINGKAWTREHTRRVTDAEAKRQAVKAGQVVMATPEDPEDDDDIEHVAAS